MTATFFSRRFSVAKSSPSRLFHVFCLFFIGVRVFNKTILALLAHDTVTLYSKTGPLGTLLFLRKSIFESGDFTWRLSLLSNGRRDQVATKVATTWRLFMVTNSLFATVFCSISIPSCLTTSWQLIFLFKVALANFLATKKR